MFLHLKNMKMAIRKINTFKKESDRSEIQNAMLKELQSVATKYGLGSITNSGYSWSDLSCTFKFEAKCDSNTAEAQAKNLTESKRLGFNSNIVDRTFIHNKKTYTVTGFNLGRKCSVGCVREDGKPYGFEPSFLKTLIKFH